MLDREFRSFVAFVMSFVLRAALAYVCYVCGNAEGLQRNQAFSG